jgi:hypothetical protein
MRFFPFASVAISASAWVASASWLRLRVLSDRQREQIAVGEALILLKQRRYL